MNEEQRKNALAQLEAQLKDNPDNEDIKQAIADFGGTADIAQEIKDAKTKKAVQDLVVIDLDLRKSLPDLKEIALASL